MIDPCTTLPLLGYVINITMNGNQDIYASTFISDTMGDDIAFNYSQLFNQTLKPNTVYVLTVTPTNIPPSKLLMHLFAYISFCVLIP